MEKIHPDGSAKTNPIKPNQSRSEFTPKESQRNMQQRKNPPQLKRLDKRNVLSALKLRNEAEGTRTLNLRIDSPMLYPIELRPHNLNRRNSIPPNQPLRQSLLYKTWNAQETPHTTHKDNVYNQ